jgi:hypothetical protein
MKELYVVLYSAILGSATCQVLADEIVVEDDGVKLLDAGRCIAYFSNNIFRGVYRKPMMMKEDGSLVPYPEESEVQQDDSEGAD